ncbi:MAG TPA: hypothetical protein PK127_02050 [Clostridiales bacterium]|nr:hypothetical protein [Clostridiales bacterium]HPV01248.1 hypothetical protein [Clostridiales bacterium]
MEKPENGHGHMILSYGENEKNQEDIISIITSDYLTIELAEKISLMQWNCSVD